MLVFEHAAERRRLKRGRVVIEPPAHLRIGAEPKVHARVIVGVERHAFERIAVAMDHADRFQIDLLVDDFPIERCKQRGRGRAVEARVVEKHFEHARQSGEIIPLLRARGMSAQVLQPGP
jgi:hypothetical protein